MLKSLIRSALLHAGALDAAPISGSITLPGYEWLGKVHPVVEEYRVVEIDGNYGLQAKVGEHFIDVKFYDDGCDDYGRLNAGCWKPVSEACRWTPAGLKRLRDRLQRKPPEVVVIA